MSHATDAYAKKAATDFGLLALYMVLAVGLSPRNYLLLGIMGALTLARLITRWHKHHAVAFLAGAVVLGGSMDLLFVHNEVYTYAYPDEDLLPVYMIVLWGQAFLAFRSMVCLIDSRSRPYWSPWKFDKKANGGIALYAAVTASVALFPSQPLVPTIVSLVAVAILLLADQRRDDLLLLVLAAVGGTVAEGLLVYWELYSFSTASLVGLPWWVPPYWAYVLLFLRRFRGRLEML